MQPDRCGRRPEAAEDDVEPGVGPSVQDAEATALGWVRCPSDPAPVREPGAGEPDRSGSKAPGCCPAGERAAPAGSRRPLLDVEAVLPDFATSDNGSFEHAKP